MVAEKKVLNNIEVGSGVLEIERDGRTYSFEASEDGGTLSIAREVEFIEVDEVVGRVAAYITGEEASFQLNSLEVDVELLREAIGQGTIETVEVNGQNERVLTFGGSSEVSVSKLTYTVPRRVNRDLNLIIELNKVVSVSDIEAQQTKQDPTSYPVVFEAMNDMSKEEGARLGKIIKEVSEDELEEAFYSVNINEENSDDEVDQGSELTVVSDIINTGELDGEQDITMDFGDDEGVAEELGFVVEAGGEEELTLTYSVPSDAEVGETEVTVHSEDDSDSYMVMVN